MMKQAPHSTAHQFFSLFIIIILAALATLVLFQAISSLLDHHSIDRNVKARRAAINIQAPIKNQPIKENLATITSPPPEVAPQLRSALNSNTRLKLPETIIDLDDLQLDINAPSKLTNALQRNWIQPSQLGAGASSNMDYIGQRNTGTKEIRPISSRMPLIPKLAYDNRLDGWVLVAFKVTNQGIVDSLQIMDAQPKGIFEEYAISAVSSWRYEPFNGKEKYLSQKIEFKWSNYSYNYGELKWDC